MSRPADSAAGRPVAVVATVRGADLPPAGELKAAAKAAGAPRQAVRFLDAMALPAFVAGVAALDAAGVTDGERCGLFTVGGWDPQQHQPDLGEAGDGAGYTEVARHYITTALPTDWLRKMLNNVLCQLSMTRNLRGPNNHFVGGAGALAAALAFGRRSVASGAADHVLVLAFDAPSGHESDHEVPGDACALVLGVAPAGTPAGHPADGNGNGNGHGPDGAGAIGEPCGPRGIDRAVDALEALIAGVRSAPAGPEAAPAAPTPVGVPGGR